MSTPISWEEAIRDSRNFQRGFTRDQRFMKQAYAEMSKMDEQESLHNAAVMKEAGITESDLEELLEDCYLNGAMQIVEMEVPEGSCDLDSTENFEILVEQWSTGHAGDTYGGFIYANLCNGKWLRIPYYC